MHTIAGKSGWKALCRLILCLSGVVVVGLYGKVFAQDILTPGMTCYNDILEDWRDQDNVNPNAGVGAVNVALGKTATQSSTDENGSALRAVDGNTDGVYGNSSVTHTGLEARAWWQVDLGQIYSIDSVRIYNRTDCCAERLSNFTVSLSPDGSEWPNSQTITGQCGNPSKFVFNTGARYVRVQLNGTNNLSIAELQVFAPPRSYRTAIYGIIPTLPATEQNDIKTRFDALAGSAANSPEMEALYVRACSVRRAMRMSSYIEKFRKVIFSQHKVRGDNYFFANVWRADGYAGKGIELLTMNGYYGSIEHLLPTGEARDPDISFDGKKVLFSWRGGHSGDNSNYHLFEMDIASKTTRKITGNSASTPGYQWGCNDYEAIYLPNGNILFHSTRHIQEIDCVWGPAVNMFLCDKDGKYVRRVTYDQVPTSYPCLLPNGQVLYCRWDYNDKSHTYAHALFIMNPDGTAQREFYNNNSWWPTMILQQRPIPGTDKVMAMIGGYHTKQSGKIGVIDRSLGMGNGKGVTLLAPVRLPKDDDLDAWGSIPPSWAYPFQFDASEFPRANARPLDQWGQNPPMFAYPYPFDENAFLVSFRPASKQSAWADRFGLYFMTADGSRELLYYDGTGSCCSPVVVAPRTIPQVPASRVDYSRSTGIFQIMDVYHGQSPVMDGVARGSIKRLRVAGLEYRAGPEVGFSEHFGEGCINYGGATYHTPIATGSASWDVKRIIGETPVHDDGSVNFIAPARTPLFFQLLDAKGEVVQTMRSWTMVQPGETFACYGCHESQLTSTPALPYIPRALQQSPVELEDFYGPPRGFSFAKEVQPILNSKCVSCHRAGNTNGINLEGGLTDAGNGMSFPVSYLNLVAHPREKSESKYVNWFNAESSPLLQPPYRAGSCKSNLVTMLENGHRDVSLTKEEFDKIKCWIDIGIPASGSYDEGMSSTDKSRYASNMAKRRLWEEEEQRNINGLLQMVGSRDFSSPHKKIQSRADLWKFEASFAGNYSRMINLRFVVPHPLEPQKIRIELHDLKGRLIQTLVDKLEEAGNHTRYVPVSSLTPGQYVIRMKSDGFTGAKMILNAR